MEGTDPRSLLSVQNLLLHEMREGIYRYAELLPSENVLAERLSISRTQLRDSLAQLEREGFITRRQGVGTVINRHVLGVKVRADMEVEFIDMIRACGGEGEERLLRFERMPADAKVAQRLNIRPGDEVLLVVRIALANGLPTIYCEDYVPGRLLPKEPYPTTVLEKPIFAFLRDCCGVEAYMDLTDLHPAAADAGLSAALGVPEGTPLLYMDERDFDINGMAVLYARQYYVDGVITHTLLRKKF